MVNRKHIYEVDLSHRGKGSRLFNPHFLTLVDEVWRGEALGTPIYLPMKRVPLSFT
jgi:hypothetical protein